MSSKYIKYKGLTYKMVDVGEDKNTKTAAEVYDFKKIAAHFDEFISKLKDKDATIKRVIVEVQKIKQKTLNTGKMPAKDFSDFVFYEVGRKIHSMSRDYNSSDSNLIFNDDFLLTGCHKG